MVLPGKTHAEIWGHVINAWDLLPVVVVTSLQLNCKLKMNGVNYTSVNWEQRGWKNTTMDIKKLKLLEMKNIATKIKIYEIEEWINFKMSAQRELVSWKIIIKNTPRTQNVVRETFFFK